MVIVHAQTVVNKLSSSQTILHRQRGKPQAGLSSVSYDTHLCVATRVLTLERRAVESSISEIVFRLACVVAAMMAWGWGSSKGLAQVDQPLAL